MLFLKKPVILRLLVGRFLYGSIGQILRWFAADRDASVVTELINSRRKMT